MATSSQPLLDFPNRTLFSCRKVYIALFLCTIISATVFFATHLIQTSPSILSLSPDRICDQSHDPKLCHSMISEAVSDGVVKSNGLDLLQSFLMKSVPLMGSTIRVAKSTNEQSAMADCIELLDMSIDRVTDSIVALASRSKADVHTWLSGVLTNHVTCLDGLQKIGKSKVKTLLEDLISRAKISLAMLVKTLDPNDKMLRPINGKLPKWVTRKDRKLLESSGNEIEADLVVAQDGSEDYVTVAEAVAAAPEKSKVRFIIHVTSGIYEENVEVGKRKKNLMIVGDGMASTFIRGSLNVVDGNSTFKSATLAAVGDEFILQDICIQNTAGPEKHQAVALRVGADQSVINRCRIDAYQDTLYTHSLRQFYRECYVIGTIDFIFGNAAVVFQNCSLIARKPMAKQKIMVTAQGRTDPNQNTGTSIQNCEIIASEDLAPVQDSYPSYLGRPWKEYSRTVVMQSYISDHIDPTGWAPWSGDFALETLYYGEYLNSGPGAGTSGRVNWTGYQVITDPDEAKKFTVAELIQGGSWLNSTGVSYIEGL